jgi:hypothetical protein
MQAGDASERARKERRSMVYYSYHQVILFINDDSDAESKRKHIEH